jgi:ABC-type lipoprotein release transport system permease subunit
VFIFYAYLNLISSVFFSNQNKENDVFTLKTMGTSRMPLRMIRKRVGCEHKR